MSDYSQLFAQLEAANNLPAGMLNAVFQTESNGNPNAIGPPTKTGERALGGFQQMKAMRQDYGVQNPFDVNQAAPGAAQFLKDNLAKFGSVRAALAAYNAGPGAVEKSGGTVPDYPETQKYVAKAEGKMPQLDPDAVKWDDGGSQQAAPAPVDPSKVHWDDEKAAAAPAAQQGPSLMDQLTRQLGLTARAAGHGLANAAGVIGNPLNATINSAGRAIGMNPNLSTNLDQVLGNAVDRATPQPQGGIENSVQGIGATVANPLSYAVPMGAANTVRGAAMQGIGQGIAATAANEPIHSDTNPVAYLKSLALGGATGGMAGGVTGAIGRTAAGANLSPEAQAMLDRNVTMTPGQALGGQVQRVENTLGSTVPIMGHTIQEAKTAAFEDMNRAAYEQVMAPVGGQVPREVGRDAIETMRNDLGQRMDDVYAQSAVRADLPFAQDMAPISNAVARMPTQWRDRFNNLLNDNILSRTQQGGTLTGEDLQKAQTAFSNELSTLGRSDDPWAQDLREQVQATRTALDNAVARQNPQQAPTMAALRQAYANFAIVQKAASSVNKDRYPFTPSQLSAAVKAKNSTVDKGGYARGQALMQDISDAAQKTLGNTIPDSGSAGRLALMHALGGGGIVAAAMTNPHLLIAPGIATALYGTNIGRQAMLAAIARRPEVMRALGNGVVGNAGQIGGILGGGYAAGQQQR